MTNKGEAREPLTILEGKSIFGKLVPPSTDSKSKHEIIIGKLAYAQYIIQKYQFIEKSKQDNGVYPGEAKIRTLISYFDDHGDALEILKTKAETELGSYTDELLYNKTEEIIIKHKSFWNSVSAGIAGAFIYSIIIALVIFSATIGMPDTKFSRIAEILIENGSEHEPSTNNK